MNLAKKLLVLCEGMTADQLRKVMVKMSKNAQKYQSHPVLGHQYFMLSQDYYDKWQKAKQNEIDKQNDNERRGS